MIVPLLFVLAASLAGAGFAAAWFYRGESMPLYNVERTDEIQSGEFVSALVIAGGTSQARNAVAHLLKPGQKVSAEKLDVSGPRGGGRIKLLSTEFDESPTLDDALAADEYAGDVSQAGSFGWNDDTA